MDLSIGAWFEASIIEITTASKEETQPSQMNTSCEVNGAKHIDDNHIDDNHNIKDENDNSEMKTDIDLKENGITKENVKLTNGKDSVHTDDIHVHKDNSIIVSKSADETKKEVPSTPTQRQSTSDGFTYHVKFEG